ncbi:Lysophospholipid transporter LplT / 2-acylglycerophosphoethanolamine acyltransferase [hydrothermal vent metagenome]|uniref:Lysophospholipid transporter LplT / 2-acylglycerophosphoethanolamine acyltransferase n=1 Tax=hydrothermal vent metagenome TaxID=652676 RepID=A0A3B0WLZ7_9ZZZZ
MKNNKVTGQFELLKQKRFLPFFITQFLGALNDNIFKNALIILIAFQGAELIEGDADLLINAAAALFILPFFLFSATAGQWIDKYEKSKSIRLIKLLEIIIMLIAAFAFNQGYIYLLIALLFFMGAQSTFFGPAKYSYIPQHLKVVELVEGNALVQMGTFIAILVGTIVGGVLIAEEQGRQYVAYCIVFFAVLGYLSSRFIPLTPSLNEGLKINWNVFSETYRNIKFLKTNRTVFLSILGISWFWFLGATYLVQLPNYTKTVLGGNEQVVTLLLTLFTIGIGTGSLLCNWLSGKKIEIGLVPFGSIGLTVFGIDLYFSQPETVATTVLGIAEFLSTDYLRLIVDVVMTGLFGGLYIVPLMAMVQQRSQAEHLSRVIAGNNIINSLLMVLSAIIAIVVLSSGFSIAQLFLFVAVLNALVAIYIYTLVPEFLMRFMVWLLIHSIYHVRTKGLDNIPDEGPMVLVCNHVSFVDALIIGGCIRRPVRFVMYYKVYNLPILNFVFRTAKTISIAGKYENETLLNKAFDDIDEALSDGDVVCIFPEGKLTADGEMNTFRDGVERIINRQAVPVVPMALQGLWGSAFSRQKSNIFYRLFKGFKSSIGLVVGERVEARDVSAAMLQEKVSALYGDSL